MPSIDLNDPVAVLVAASQALERANLEAAAYGGLALAVYGEPRETKDADLAVAGVSGAQGEAALRTAGLWNDAECTVHVAALHDRDKRRRLPPCELLVANR